MGEGGDKGARAGVVVITGASAGVGRTLARLYGARGARVGLIARGRDGLAAAAREVDAAGGRALVLPLDVADAEAVRRAAEQVERDLGPIDVWINNAMLSVFAPVRETTPAEFRRVTEVTYLGVVHGTLAALGVMLPRDRGVIVQVGSALAYRGIPLQAAYCAAKHAIQGFHDSLRAELLHEGRNVQVTMVQLPALNTPQFSWVRTRLPNHPRPVPPVFAPELAAEAIAYAADHPRREYLVGTPTVQAVTGDRMAPGLLDRYLARSGYTAQQTDEAVAPDRPDNLDAPLPGDWGAHGIFGAEARRGDPLWWASRHRALAGGLLGALVGLGLAAARRR